MAQVRSLATKVGGFLECARGCCRVHDHGSARVVFGDQKGPLITLKGFIIGEKNARDLGIWEFYIYVSIKPAEAGQEDWEEGVGKGGLTSLTWGRKASHGLAWLHVVSLGTTWFQQVSFGFTWLHLVSFGFTLINDTLMDDTCIYRFHLVSLCFTWFMWFHQFSFGLTWFRLVFFSFRLTYLKSCANKLLI